MITREKTGHLWQPSGTSYPEKYGKALPVTVVAELEDDMRDQDAGPMYVITLPNGEQTHAFGDELDPEPVSLLLEWKEDNWYPILAPEATG